MAVELKKRKKAETFDIVNTIFVVLITILFLYPLYFCIVASLSAPSEVMAGNTILWFKGFNFDNYKHAFQEKQLWVGYRNTIIYTVLGTLYNLVMTIPTAYALSKRDLPFRKAISWLYLLTMYFGGGMIPSYFLIKSLGLLDNPLVMIVGTGCSAFNLIITRQYFLNNIPGELYEAAAVDGGNEWHCFSKIAMPLAKPIVAVVALYCAVGRWNSYFNALLYIRSDEYKPLQLVLREILITTKSSPGDVEITDPDMMVQILERMLLAEGMQYAVIFIASAPLLIAFPFIQKYFVQGTMVGSVKG